MTARRGGFTLIELLIVLSMVAVLATLAAGSYRQVVQNVRAVQITAEMRTATVAAYEAFIETGEWPADAEPGVVPPEIAARAPGLRFSGPGYLIAWKNSSDGETVIRGVTMIGDEPEMEAAVAARMPSAPGQNADPSSNTRGRPFMAAGPR